MATFISLMNCTEQGVQTIQDSPGRVTEARQQLSAAGIDITSIFVTMGRYDLIAIVEAPSAEAVASAVLSIAGQGNIRSETLHAFSYEDFASNILPHVN